MTPIGTPRMGELHGLTRTVIRLRDLATRRPFARWRHCHASSTPPLVSPCRHLARLSTCNDFVIAKEGASFVGPFPRFFLVFIAMLRRCDRTRGTGFRARPRTAVKSGRPGYATIHAAVM